MHQMAEHPVDGLIRQWRGGSTAARDQLVGLLHPELKIIASAQLRRERNVSFSSGDLVNDAILRLVRLGRIDIADRAHIIALAARLMRNILVDHARSKRTDKRAHLKVELNPDIDGEQRIDLITLETALKRESGPCRLIEPDSPELANIGDAREAINMQKVYRMGEVVWSGPGAYR